MTALVSLSAVCLTGCAASKTSGFALSFLPSSPKPIPTEPPLTATASATSKAPTPQATPNLYARALPANLDDTRPASTASFVNAPTSDPGVARAESLLSAGRRQYQAGDLDAARRSFDGAIDEMMGSVARARTDRSRLERQLETMVQTIYRYDIDGLGAGEADNQQSFDKAPLEDVIEMTFPVDPSLKPKVRDEVLATSSQLPLTVNDSVLSFIHYFSGDRGRKTLIAGLRRSGRYKAMISRVLAEEKVPQELIYLAQAESGFLPRAVSKAAAGGMWQFVVFRGRQYGLMQSSYHDDRMDPEKATRAAARHLRDLYNQFGDWYLAMAAYNCGPGRVDKAVQQTGYADFWELRERGALPRETTNYVPIILAMTIMVKNAGDYGLTNIEGEPTLEYDSLTMTGTTSLALLADLAVRPVSELREMNPSLLSNLVPAGLEVHVPKGSGPSLMANLDRIPEGQRTAWRIHRVSTGDTLLSISKLYSVPISSLAMVNNNPTLQENQLLYVPAVERSSAKPSHWATAHARSALKHGHAQLAGASSRGSKRPARGAHAHAMNTRRGGRASYRKQATLASARHR